MESPATRGIADPGRRGVFRLSRTVVLLISAALVVVAVATAVSRSSSPETEEASVHAAGEEVPPLEARARPAMVWTGSELLVVGGSFFGNTSSPVPPGGVAYQPAGGTWRPLPAIPSAEPLIVTDGVWTGEELIVLGVPCATWEEEESDEFTCSPGGVVGAALDPEKNSWRLLETPNEISATAHRQAIQALGWTGSEAVFTLEGRKWLLSPSSGDWRQVPESPFDPKLVCVADETILSVSFTNKPIDGQVDGVDADPADGVDVATDYAPIPTAAVLNLEASQPLSSWAINEALPTIGNAPNYFNRMCAGEHLLLFGENGVDTSTMTMKFSSRSAHWSEMARPQSRPGVDSFTLWTGTEALIWGSDSVLAYNVADNTWREARDVPTPTQAEWIDDRAILYYIEDGRSARYEFYTP